MTSCLQFFRVSLYDGDMTYSLPGLSHYLSILWNEFTDRQAWVNKQSGLVNGVHLVCCSACSHLSQKGGFSFSRWRRVYSASNMVSATVARWPKYQLPMPLITLFAYPHGSCVVRVKMEPASAHLLLSFHSAPQGHFLEGKGQPTASMVRVFWNQLVRTMCMHGLLVVD
jgi:hypothetical protein